MNLRKTRGDTDLPFASANQHVHSIDFMYLKLCLLMVLPEDESTTASEKDEQHILYSVLKVPTVGYAMSSSISYSG